MKQAHYLNILDRCLNRIRFLANVSFLVQSLTVCFQIVTTAANFSLFCYLCYTL